jgi:hypothetical protein
MVAVPGPGAVLLLFHPTGESDAFSGPGIG